MNPTTDYPNGTVTTYNSRAITDGQSDAYLPDVNPISVIRDAFGLPVPELTDGQGLLVNNQPI